MTISGPMRAALDASLAVRGSTSPNPWVGAAVVRGGQIIALGATEPPPGRHAEAVALDAAGPLARGAELYVTLEPCIAFAGKRTPACSTRIIEASLARVVVALEDADPAVAGKGIAALRAAGVSVEAGDGQAEVAVALRPYLKHRRTGLPWVIAKFAASLDGRTATAAGDSRWITGETAREVVHQQRAWVDAILAGSGTVLADDPALTARPGGVAADRQPLRVLVSANARIPATARVFQEPGNVIVATAVAPAAGWRAEMTARGAQLIECEPGPGGVNLRQLLAVLGARGAMSLWVEGGSAVLGSLFDEDLVDEVWAFIAPLIIGGAGAVPAVAGRGAATIASAWRLLDPAIEQVGEDVLVRGLIRPAP